MENLGISKPKITVEIVYDVILKINILPVNVLLLEEYILVSICVNGVMVCREY